MAEPGKNPYGNIAKGGSDKVPDLQPIPKVEAEVVRPKAKRTSSLKKAIFASEVTDLKSFLIYDCAIPMLKTAVMDTLSRLLFNEPYRGGATKGSTVRSGGVYWSANSSSPRATSGLRDISRDFLFESKEEADEVLRGVQEWCARVGTTTVADLCRIAGLVPEPGDSDYGWYELRGGHIAQLGDSWYIELPRARRL